jgi:8-oxo-dGTP pyrophosphatase MutT (NUDIX family)
MKSTQLTPGGKAVSLSWQHKGGICMKLATLAIITWQEKTLLGLKKTGEIGKETYNGPGGKYEKEKDRDLIDCVIRETDEEIGVTLFRDQLKKVAILSCFSGDELTFEVHVYRTSDFNGAPRETKDMLPEWFANDALPFEKMLEADRSWFSRAIEGEPFCANIYYREGTKDFKKITFFPFRDTEAM